MEPIAKDHVEVGENILICRGSKYSTTELFPFEDGDVAPMTKRVLFFNAITDADITALNVPSARTYCNLLCLMRATWPDFQETEIVTLILVDVAQKHTP